jgi:hypothetical protein
MSGNFRPAGVAATAMEATMNTRLYRVRRHSDGAIDFDFYRRRAMALRRGRIRYFFRRKILFRYAFYAGALCVGLAIGESMPLPAPDCLNCQETAINLDAARRNATEQDGFVAITGQISPARPQSN